MNYQTSNSRVSKQFINLDCGLEVGLSMVELATVIFYYFNFLKPLIFLKLHAFVNFVIIFKLKMKWLLSQEHRRGAWEREKG